MTVAQAVKLLASGPKFGDVNHIFAVKLVAMASELRDNKTELEMLCDNCDGDGDCQCDCGHSHECHECGGSGYSDDFVTDQLIDEMTFDDIRKYREQIQEHVISRQAAEVAAKLNGGAA